MSSAVLNAKFPPSPIICHVKDQIVQQGPTGRYSCSNPISPIINEKNLSSASGRVVKRRVTIFAHTLKCLTCSYGRYFAAYC